jgi:hypothetical protein
MPFQVEITAPVDNYRYKERKHKEYAKNYAALWRIMGKATVEASRIVITPLNEKEFRERIGPIPAEKYIRKMR